MARILVVDDQRSIRTSVATALRFDGYDVEVAASAEEAESVVRSEGFELVLTDVRLPGMSGMDLLRSVREVSPTTKVVVMTGFGTIEDALVAMRAGAHDYLSKPFESEDLMRVVESALRVESPIRETQAGAPDDPTRFDEIIGTSRAIVELLELVEKIAATDSTALITGETGTGKELIGRAIHRASRRSERVFCAVNSAAFPETLLESELFGHRRGAFTGANSNTKGLFEHADRGTVFLDEVAEMPLSMQAKLLRFLQTGEIRPVGSEQTRCVDVRLVTATNKDLEEEVEAGRFREDLYYRLAVIPIHIPPLRKRTEDIPLLVMHFLRRFTRKQGKAVDDVDPAAMNLLVSYPWPGNVRELENCIERGVTLCSGRRIEPGDLPGRVRDGGDAEPRDLESLEVIERLHILNTLDKVGWNRKKAAEILCISTTTLWRRLKEFGVEGNDGPRSGRDVRLLSG